MVQDRFDMQQGILDDSSRIDGGLDLNNRKLCEASSSKTHSAKVDNEMSHDEQVLSVF